MTILSICVGASAFVVGTAYWLYSWHHGFTLVWPVQVDTKYLVDGKCKWYGNWPHVVMCPPREAQDSGVLLVFLPGTLSHPTLHRGFLAAAAKQHRTIGLGYRYSFMSSGEVGRVLDEKFGVDGDEGRGEALYEFHDTVVFGGPGNAFVDAVEPFDSITGRIAALLIYLRSKYPGENWNQFLDDQDQPIWNKIVMTGHSQGGTHATFLAHKLAFKRAAIMSAPQSITHPSKTFLGEPFQTKDVIGFAHEQEDSIGSIKQAFATMNIHKTISFDEQDIKSQVSIAPRSHVLLLSSIPPRMRGPRAEHASIATDGCYPNHPLNFYGDFVWPKLVSIPPS